MIANMNAQRSPEARPVSTLATALCDEYRAIHDEDVPAVTQHGPGAQEDAYYAAAWNKQQAALCLSGGGIRSAAFALGVLQALARKQLLARFHYLSTVSGGGYIGGWLTALIYARGGDVDEVQQMLADRKAPAQIGNLRQYTNYLTPQPGAASPDTWTGIILWVRNVIINWLIFAPALFAIALVPAIYRDAIQVIAPSLGWPLFLLGLIGLGIAVYCGANNMPSHAPPAEVARFARQRTGEQQARLVQRWIVLPLLAWAFIVPVVAAPSLRPIMPYGAVWPELIPFVSFLVMVGAYLIAALREPAQPERIFFRNFIWWVLASAIASIVLAIGLDMGLDQRPDLIAVLGPLWVTLAHLLESLFYVALRREAFRGDLDREWLARLSAVKVVPTLLWAIFAAVCLLLPPLVLDNWSSRFWPWVLGTFGTLTGPVAAYLARTAAASLGVGTAKNGSALTLPLNILIAIATAIFAALLFLSLARFGDIVVDVFAPVHADVVPPLRLPVDLLVFAVALLVSWWFCRRINVNRFSMHAVYRNRLVRAFLGSARTVREPDAFTGLDARDNPRMTDLFTRPNGSNRALFPVINLALNLVAGRNNAWAERKAESFTVTPLACGAAYLHRTEDVQAGKPPRGAYAATSRYAGDERETGPADLGDGMTLGTAITISGAAVSPNMGYYSAPATAFLMSLFNVRLGAWLANPAGASAIELRQPKPPNALFTLLRETLGRTDDRSREVYLSDGGHFENLGLYEMVRRRCRHIVVVDAGADPGTDFADLGNAVRKAFIDQNIEIRFEPPVSIGSRTKPAKPALNYAYAKVIYPEGGEGELIYIKPCYPDDVPIDVRAYGSASDLFPHESTLEQWFGESQFESYRRLGDFETKSLGMDQPYNTVAAFFADVHAQLRAAHGP